MFILEFTERLYTTCTSGKKQALRRMPNTLGNTGIGHLIVNLVVENYFTLVFLHLFFSFSLLCLTFCRYDIDSLNNKKKNHITQPSQLKMRSILIADVQTQYKTYTFTHVFTLIEHDKVTEK